MTPFECEIKNILRESEVFSTGVVFMKLSDFTIRIFCATTNWNCKYNVSQQVLRCLDKYVLYHFVLIVSRTH